MKQDEFLRAKYVVVFRCFLCVVFYTFFFQRLEKFFHIDCRERMKGDQETFHMPLELETI